MSKALAVLAKRVSAQVHQLLTGRHNSLLSFFDEQAGTIPKSISGVEVQ
jgi:hypothetical protein